MPEAEPTRRRLASTAVRLSVVPIVAAAFLAGCGDDDDDEQAYCVDQNNVVVDNDDCDRDYDSGVSSGFFWFFAGQSFSRGSRVPAGGDRVVATDRAALASRGGFGKGSRSSGVGRSSSSKGSSGGGSKGSSGGG